MFTEYLLLVHASNVQSIRLLRKQYFTNIVGLKGLNECLKKCLNLLVKVIELIFYGFAVNNCESNLQHNLRFLKNICCTYCTIIFKMQK
jgi:hypothetical protein